MSYGPTSSFFQSTIKCVITINYDGGPTRYFSAVLKNEKQSKNQQNVNQLLGICRSELGKGGWVGTIMRFSRPIQPGRHIDEPKLVIPGMEEAKSDRLK